MSSDRSPQDTSAASIDECLHQIRYAQAAELARTGCYLEAEALLAPKGRLPDSSRELDLLARVAAQQDRLDDAARLWTVALERDPDNVIYKDCLQRLSNIHNDEEPAAPLRKTILWCCITACGVLVIIALFLFTHRARTAQSTRPVPTVEAQDVRVAQPSDLPNTITDPVTTPAVIPPSQAVATESPESVTALRRVEQTLDQMQQTQQGLIASLKFELAAIQATNSLLMAQVHRAESRFADLAQLITDVSSNQTATHRAVESARSELAGLLAAHTPPTNPLAPFPSLAEFKPGISGVTVTTTTNGCLIHFDPGLFDRDHHFRMGGKSRLEHLAKALVQTQARFTVQVIGLAEDEPPTWPWSRVQTPQELGFQRAQYATACLRHLGIFPPDKLNALAGTPAQRPFPPPNPNNRTVVLQVQSD